MCAPYLIDGWCELPIYAYQCETGHEFDLRQGFHEEPVASCPQCEAPARRQFHAATVIYKGSGFYTTDYARKTHGADSNSKPSKKTSETPKPDTSGTSTDASSSKTKSSANSNE